MTNPVFEVMYSVMYSTLAQLGNQTSVGVARRVESFPKFRLGLPFDLNERRESHIADKREVSKAKE